MKSSSSPTPSEKRLRTTRSSVTSQEQPHAYAHGLVDAVEAVRNGYDSFDD